MNWDAIGAIGEVIGALGVIITLAYLALQIRQNTTMMRANVKQSQTTVTQNLMQVWLDNSELIMKANAGSELTAKEDYELKILARAILRGWESYCYMYDVGLLDESEWSGIKRSIERFGSQPHLAAGYMEMRLELSERLRAVIDPVVENRDGGSSGIQI